MTRQLITTIMKHPLSHRSQAEPTRERAAGVPRSLGAQARKRNPAVDMRARLLSLGTLLIALFGMVLAAGPTRGGEPDTARELTTDDGHFVVAIESRVEPIPLNELHAWVVSVSAPDGTPLQDAAIDVDGGMPMHDHGLPTAPAITEALGDGRYLLEGVKFQMPGHWTVTLAIDADGMSDTVTFNLML